MSTLNHDTELEHSELRIIIVDHTSEMLDNPDKYGIYPTGKFYDGLEAALHTYLYKQTLELIGEDIPVYVYIDALIDNKKRKAVNKYKAQLRKAAAERWGQE